MASLTEFTARTVADAFRRHVLPRQPVGELIMAGGGVKNPALIERIAALIAPIRLLRSDDFGVPSEAREAMGFAVLADLAIRGISASLPSVTGSRHETILGKLSFPRLA